MFCPVSFAYKVITYCSKATVGKSIKKTIKNTRSLNYKILAYLYNHHNRNNVTLVGLEEIYDKFEVPMELIKENKG